MLIPCTSWQCIVYSRCRNVKVEIHGIILFNRSVRILDFLLANIVTNELNNLSLNGDIRPLDILS